MSVKSTAGMLLSGATARPPGNQTYYTDLITVPGVRYTMVALHLAAILGAAVGNVFLLYFIIRNRKQTRRNVTAWLVLNLAICDLLNTTLHQPLRLIDLLRPNAKLGDSEAFCQIGGFFTCYLAAATFLTIVAIAIERWLLICYPLKAKSWLTIRNTWITLGVIWGVSFLTVLPFPIMFHYTVTIPLKETNVTFCLIDVFSKDGQGQGYFIFLFLMYYALPVCVITAAYTRVFKVLYSGGVMGNTKDENIQRVIATRRSLAKMMLFIAAMFALCEGPFFFTFLVISAGVKVHQNPIFLLMVIEFLPMISAVLNPVVYSLRAKTFRKGVTTTTSSLTRRSTLRSDLPPESPGTKPWGRKAGNAEEMVRLTSPPEHGPGQDVNFRVQSKEKKAKLNAKKQNLQLFSGHQNGGPEPRSHDQFRPELKMADTRFSDPGVSAKPPHRKEVFRYSDEDKEGQSIPKHYGKHPAINNQSLQTKQHNAACTRMEHRTQSTRANTGPPKQPLMIAKGHFSHPNRKEISSDDGSDEEREEIFMVPRYSTTRQKPVKAQIQQQYQAKMEKPSQNYEPNNMSKYPQPVQDYSYHPQHQHLPPDFDPTAGIHRQPMGTQLYPDHQASYYTDQQNQHGIYTDNMDYETYNPNLPMDTNTGFYTNGDNTDYNTYNPQTLNTGTTAGYNGRSQRNNVPVSEIAEAYNTVSGPHLLEGRRAYTRTGQPYAVIARPPSQSSSGSETGQRSRRRRRSGRAQQGRPNISNTTYNQAQNGDHRTQTSAPLTIIEHSL